MTALQRQLFAGAAPPTAVEVVEPMGEELGVLRRALVAFDSVVSVKVSSGSDDPWEDDAVVAGFTALLPAGRQLRAVTYVPPRLEHACRCRGSRVDFADWIDCAYAFLYECGIATNNALRTPTDDQQ